MVQRACSRVLCCNWLPQCRGDPLRLLRALDAVSFEDTAALALGRLLREADVFGCGCGTGGKHFPSKITVQEPSRGNGKKKREGRTLEVTLAQCVGLGVQRVKALAAANSGSGNGSGNGSGVAGLTLTPELALFWRCYVSHAGLVHSAGETGGRAASTAAGNAFARSSHRARRLAEEALEATLPPLTPLCDKLRGQWEEGSALVRAAAAKREEERTDDDDDGDDEDEDDDDDDLHEERVEESVFVQRQLLLLARAHDFGDEAGRRRCIDLLG